MCLGTSLLRDVFLAHKKSFINEHPSTKSSKSPGSLHFVGLRTPCVLLFRRVKRRQGVPLLTDFVSKQCYSISHLVQLLRIGHVATPPCEGCWSTWMNWWIDVPGAKFTSCNRKEQGFCGELVIYRAARTCPCDTSFLSIFQINGAHCVVLYLEGLHAQEKSQQPHQKFLALNPDRLTGRVLRFFHHNAEAVYHLKDGEKGLPEWSS